MAHALLNYLKQNSFEQLATEFNINVKPTKKFPNLVCLTYSQLNTPKNAITNDCRGIVLDKNTLGVVAYPFTRFNDYNKLVETPFNKEDFRAYDKIDGSLISMFFYENDWHIATKSTADADGFILQQNCTYSEYFWKVFQQLKYTLPTNTNLTYIFEFKFPSETQFITKTDKPTITLLGIRNNKTFEEIDIYYFDCDWYLAKFEKLTFDNLLQKVKTLNPTQSEGYVVCDKNFNRLKIKSPAYDYIALLKSPKDDFLKDLTAQRDNLTRLIQISQVTDYDDFIKYYEHCRLDWNKVVKAKNELKHKFRKLLEQIRELTPREIGVNFKESPYVSLLFNLQKVDDVDLFVENMNSKSYAEYIRKLM